MKLSGEQGEVVDYDFKHGDILLVNAYAGTGKTQTLYAFAKARPKARITYWVFNRSMADEARQRFSDLSNVSVSTIHSIAFRKIAPRWFRTRSFGNLRALDVLHQFSDFRESGNAFFYAKTLVDAFNEYCLSRVRDIPTYVRILANAHPELFQEISPHRFLDEMQQTWDDILKDQNRVVPHCVYLKLFQLERHVIPADYYLVDEAQDLSDVTISILFNQRGRKVFVGDRHQQLYAFAGAVNSLEKLGQHGETLHLTQSFRCPREIASVSNRYLRVLGAEKDFCGCQTPSPSRGDQAILGRSNGTLFEAAAYLVEQKKRLHFLGGFEGYRLYDIVDIAHLMADRPERIRNSYIGSFKNYARFAKYLEATNDQEFKARHGIAQKYPNAEDVYFEIRRNTYEDRRDAEFVLSTGHKVKGAEFDSVRLLEGFLAIQDYVLTDINEELSRDELHLLYVASTRGRCEVSIPPMSYLSDSDTVKLCGKIKGGNLVLI